MHVYSNITMFFSTFYSPLETCGAFFFACCFFFTPRSRGRIWLLQIFFYVECARNLVFHFAAKWMTCGTKIYKDIFIRNNEYIYIYDPHMYSFFVTFWHTLQNLFLRTQENTYAIYSSNQHTRHKTVKEANEPVYTYQYTDLFFYLFQFRRSISYKRGGLTLTELTYMTTHDTRSNCTIHSSLKPS